MIQVMDCLFYKKQLGFFALYSLVKTETERGYDCYLQNIKGINAEEGGEPLKNNTGTTV